MKKNYDHVIWDFNGTILNDIQIGIESTNLMLSQRGLPVLPDVEAYREVFDFPVEEYYRRLGFDFEKEDYYTVLAPLWVSLYEERRGAAQLFPGVQPLTSALRRAGIAQSILSASDGEMMRRQLQERGALAWFDEVWGNDGIYAHGKSGLAAAWRRAHPADRAVMLGDTVHDFDIARVIGADCILIAAGHHAKERLLTCNTTVVDTLEDCLPLLLG
ncbi:MAG: HAD family hydrolase [Ruminococcaceae bacterium]|nr:HAD family hydrolase [Oscillospiraceae bacterium]